MTVRGRGQSIYKHITVPLEKNFQLQEDGTIIVNGFFTSDAIDEVGDIITREATENAIPKYRQWGNIRYMHQPKPVATMLRIGTDDKLKWNEVEIHVIDPDAVFQVKNNLLKALSVGIWIRSWDDIEIDEETGAWVITAYDLVEISLVDHPANYDARLFLDDDKSIFVNPELRQLFAQHGFAMVSKALGAVTTSLEMEEEIDMDGLEKDLQLEEEIIAEETIEEEVELSVDDSEEEEVDEELELSTEEEIVSEETEEVELSAEEEETATSLVEQIVDAEVVDLTEETEAEEAEEELVLEDLDVRLEEDTEGVDSVLLDSQETEEEEEADKETDISVEEAIEEITEDEEVDPDEVKAHLPLARALLDALSEAETEVLEEEQVEVERTEEIEEATDEVTALKSQIDDLGSQVAELTEIVKDLLGKPAERKGKITITPLPHESLEEIEEEAEEEGDLMKTAISKYIASPGRVVIRERR